MTFAFICDSYFQKKRGLTSLSALVKSEIPNHSIITITADEFLQTGKFPDGASGVIVERGT
jgi:response regulator of citrate/malate metabolism